MECVGVFREDLFVRLFIILDGFCEGEAMICTIILTTDI